jgi:hypothetical protein
MLRIGLRSFARISNAQNSISRAQPCDFHRALCDTKGRYEFEMRGLKLEGSWLTFYIKPADGYKLPKIMQWLMNPVH